jgi:hypothetical protein
MACEPEGIRQPEVLPDLDRPREQQHGPGERPGRV